MSDKITVKRIGGYLRFLYDRKEILFTFNTFTPENADEVLIRDCLVPWLKETLLEERRERKEIIAREISLIALIELHEQALQMGVMMTC